MRDVCPSCGYDKFHFHVMGQLNLAYCVFCNEFCGIEGCVPWSEKELDDARMPFGKHSGKRIKELPREYLEWLKENCELKGIVKFAVARIFDRC